MGALNFKNGGDDERGNGIAVKNRGKETISSRHHYLRFGMSSEWPDRIYSTGMAGHGVGETPNEVRRLVSSWSPTFVCGSPTHMRTSRRIKRGSAILLPTDSGGDEPKSHDRSRRAEVLPK